MALIEFEKRAVQDVSDLPGFAEIIARSKTGTQVNRVTAMRLAAVYACVDAISSDLAGLPMHVKLKKGNGVEKVSDHPAYEKIKLNPNPEQRAFVFRQIRKVHVLLAGNAYSFIERSSMNPVKNLWLLDPDCVEMVRNKTINGRRGALKYRVQDGPNWKYYSPGNILHIKGPSWDGLLGESVITSHARDVLGIGVEMDTFMANFFKKGMNPGGILRHPKSLGANKDGFIKALKKRYGGNENSKTPLILEDDMDYKPYDVKMVDQQFLEILKLNKVDICGIFGVPQSRISISESNTNFNNTEQENRRYVRSGLLKWAIQDEQEMNMKLLTESERKAGMFIKYNFDGLLRGDSKDRAELSEKWWRMGVPVNDLLELEDRNPVDGGDVGRVQLNTVSIKEADSIQQGQNIKPEQKGLKKRSVENRGALDVIAAGRDRITSRFYPLIMDAAQKIVNRESIALKKEIKKQIGERAKADFESWINEFYPDFREYIERSLGPALMSYAETIQEAVASEIDIAPGFDDEMKAETKAYINGFIDQYVGSSEGQLRQLLAEKGFEDIEQRADEWHEKRAKKVTDNETVGVASMVASATILGAGYRLKWKTRGKSCPFCNQLNNKTVSRKGEPFLHSGTELDAGDYGKMTVRQTLYAPLHQGCDCLVVAG